MTRAEILDVAKKCITGQREQEYGSPEDNFAVIARFWNAYINSNPSIITIKNGLARGSISSKDVAIMMCLLKIARITTGTATDDSFVDLSGYAACGGEIVSKSRENKGDD